MSSDVILQSLNFRNLGVKNRVFRSSLMAVALCGVMMSAACGGANPGKPGEVKGRFRYFEEGSDTTGEDLDSVVEGITFVRLMTADLKKRQLIAEEEVPGDHVQSDDDLRQFVRDSAWGHHAADAIIAAVRDGH